VDNTTRRVSYIARRYPQADAALAVRTAYREGLTDEEMGLTPAQCRRLRHKRGGAHTRRKEASARRAAALARRWDVLAPRVRVSPDVISRDQPSSVLPSDADRQAFRSYIASQVHGLLAGARKAARVRQRAG
jgi:hypothetical protein